MKIIFVLALLSLASCTSTQVLNETRDKCESTNFEVVGRAEGREGKKAEFHSIEDRCAEAGVTVENQRADYFRGYGTGIASYCSTENGELIGQRGLEYRRVCPIALEPLFLKGYNRGRSEYKTLESKNQLMQALVLTGESSTKQCDFDADCEIETNCADGSCEEVLEGQCIDARCEF